MWRMGSRNEEMRNTLYNRPLSRGVDYFINNLKGNNSPIMDKNAWGFLKQKAEMEIEENERALL